MTLRANVMIKKRVSDSEAHEVGVVTDFEFEFDGWDVTYLFVKIPAKICKELEISKMLAKTAKVPVNMVSKVGDFIELAPTLKELIDQVEILRSMK